MVMEHCYLDMVPRDLKIKIVSMMDMDTRMKTGMIFKLRTPQHLVSALNKMLNMLVVGNSISYIKLGPYRPVFQNIRDDMECMYTLTRYFNTCSIDPSSELRSVNYTVCHVSQHDNNENIIKMKIYYVHTFDKY
jgi:hypothetical protein